MEQSIPSPASPANPRPTAASVAPPVAPPLAPQPTPASSVRVHVGRLALDGFNLPPSGARATRAAFEAELARLLATGDLPPSLAAGGWRRGLAGAPLSISSWSDPADLGRQIARVLHEGLRR